MVSLDLAGIGSGFGALFSSMLTWAIVALAFFVGAFLMLKFKQSRKFKLPVLEITGLGQGKVSVNLSKAGWFKKNRRFFGLIEVGGEQIMLTNKGKRRIYNISSTDYHEFNNKRCVICKRKDDDPEVLVPLSKVEVTNLKLVTSIAPADYRDTAIQLMEEKRKETMSWLDKNAPLLIAMGVFVFGLIALVIIFNFAKGESSAWREMALQMKNAGTIIANSSAP